MSIECTSEEQLKVECDDLPPEQCPDTANNIIETNNFDKLVN